MAYLIIVEFRAKPDKVETCAELIDRHAHNSRTLEDGCLDFDVCQDPDDPARFVLYEAYRDQAAHARHLEMDSWKPLSTAFPKRLRSHDRREDLREIVGWRRSRWAVAGAPPWGGARVR